MGLSAQLDATLTTGGSSGCSDSGFPGGVSTIAFGLYPATKTYSVSAGGVINAASANSFAPVDSIGTGGQVTQAITLYLRTTSSGMKVQLTFADPEGGADIVSIVPLLGTLLVEPPAGGYLKGLAIKGTGAVEFWAAGTQ